MKSRANLIAATAALLLFALPACQGPTGPRFPDPTGPKDGEDSDQSFAPVRDGAPTWVDAASPTEWRFTPERGWLRETGAVT
jgi:hypothetical protein